jgi:uncharacterized repeat protein (TIGR02543 family)
VPNRTGYTFGGWYGSDDLTTGGEVTGIVQGSMEDKEYWAKWTLVSYDITYILDGGTNAEENPAAYTIETPAITLADPFRTGYSFQGWYTEGGFVNRVTEVAQGSTGDKTFHARWVGNGKDITAFIFASPSAAGVIDGNTKTITVSFPNYTDITSLVPTVSVSPEATVSPASGQAQNFSGPVTYTITAEDGSSAVYTVAVMAPGQVTIVFPGDAASGALTDSAIILGKTPIPATHTLTVSGDFDSYRWRVNGAFKGNGKSITLDAGDYTAAVYQITVEVTLGGAVYSKTGTFTVRN